MVFIHESIKTRVETNCRKYPGCSARQVFIHESIKTRVETIRKADTDAISMMSLSMNPLKQGLKRCDLAVFRIEVNGLYP